MLKRETREQWGARPPKNRRYDVNPLGLGIHWPGSSANFRRMDHKQHQATMRAWQRYHMDVKGSNDLEYGSVICPCLIWMEGRTEFDNWLVRVGSNGSAATNYTHGSIQLMVGINEGITQKEKLALAEAIATERKHGWGNDVKPHSALNRGTECPGNAIRAALPEIIRLANNWDQEENMPLTPAEIETIVSKTAARVNIALGDGNAKGDWNEGAEKPELAARKIRDIESKLDKVLALLSDKPEPDPEPEPCDYLVQKGDTYWSLSQKWNVSVQDIRAANPSVDENNLQEGKTCLNRP